MHRLPNEFNGWLLRLVAVGTVIFFSGVAGAQDPASGDPSQPAARPAASQGGSGNPIGGLFNRVGGSIGGLFGGVPDKPLLVGLKPTYQRSNEAIGEQRDLQAKRIQGTGLVHVPELAGYANQVLSSLKQASGVEGVPGAVYVLATGELVALSTADGNVFVSLGWFRSMESEDELAALLAHELGHVLLRHHETNIFGKVQKQMQNLFAMGAGLRNQLNQIDSSTASTALTPGQKQTLRNTQYLVQLTEGALHPAWNRRQELDADRIGYDLLHKAGYSASDMFVVLGRIADWEEKQAALRKVRDAQLEAGINELAASGKLDQAASVGLKTAGQGLVEVLGAKHDDAGKRGEELNAYKDKHYATAPRQARKAAEYGRVQSSRAVGPVVEAYRKTFEAINQATLGSDAAAERQLAEVTGKTSAIAAHSLPNTQMYELMKKQGREREGLRFLQASFKAPEPHWKPFQLAADMYVRQGNRDAVLTVGDTAWRQFQESPALLPELIQMYTASGHTEKVKELVGLCTLTYVEYRDECNKRAARK